MTKPTIEIGCSKCGQPLLIPKPSSAVAVNCPKCETPLQVSPDGKVRRRSDDEFAFVPAALQPERAPLRAKGFTARAEPAAAAAPTPQPQPGRVYMPMDVSSQRKRNPGPLIRGLLGLSVSVVCVIGLIAFGLSHLPQNLPDRLADNPLLKDLPRKIPAASIRSQDPDGLEAVVTILEEAFQLQVDGFEKLPTARGGENYAITAKTVDEIASLWNRSEQKSQRAQEMAPEDVELSAERTLQWQQKVDSWSQLEDRYLNGRPWRTTYPMLQSHWLGCQYEFNQAIKVIQSQFPPQSAETADRGGAAER